MKICRTLIVLTLLALLVVGCGQGGDQATAAPDEATATEEVMLEDSAETEEVATEDVDTEEAAADEESADEAVTDEQLDIDTVSGLSQFDSYRTQWVITYEYVDAGTTTTMDMVTEFVREPAAQRISMTTESDADEDSSGTYEIITVDGATYMNTGDSWIAMQSSDTEAEEAGWWWSDPENVFGGEEGEYVGKETINGMETKHYHYTYNDTAFAMGLSSIDSGEADVWVSTEYDVYIKYIVDWTGSDEEEGNVALHMEAIVDSINEPITIAAPEGVDAPAMPEDLPLLDGATDLFVMSGMYSYKVTTSVDDTAIAIKDFMAGNGWTVESDMGASMTTYTKDGRTATIMLGEEDGATSVVIMSSEAEASE